MTEICLRYLPELPKLGRDHFKILKDLIIRNTATLPSQFAMRFDLTPKKAEKLCSDLARYCYVTETELVIEGDPQIAYELNEEIVDQVLAANGEHSIEEFRRIEQAAQQVLAGVHSNSHDFRHASAISSADTGAGDAASPISPQSEAPVSALPVPEQKTVMLDGAKVPSVLARPMSGLIPKAPENPAPAGKKTENIIPPEREWVVDQAKKYIKERCVGYPKLKTIDPEVAADYFMEFYGSKGWMVGKTKMKNWSLSLLKALKDWSCMHNTRNLTPQEKEASEAMENEEKKRAFVESMKNMGLRMESEPDPSEPVDADYEDVTEEFNPMVTGPKFENYGAPVPSR